MTGVRPGEGVIVVDCSVAVNALLGGVEAGDRLASTTAFASHLIDVEVVSAVRGLRRGGHVTADQAERLVTTWPQLGVIRFAMHPLLTRVWSLRDALSAHDACYVALAEELGCPLVTADARLARAARVGCDVQLLSP